MNAETRNVRMLRWKVPPAIWFSILFVLFCCAYEYGRILHQRPFPHHIMRQTDCLGLTWNYAFTDPDLFQPRMMNLHADDNTTGRTAGEFPLLYWIVGMIWRMIGKSEFVYRALGLALHFVGSLALFGVARGLLRSAFWGGWTALLFFTSPTIVYFTISFLPDVPALDLALIGWWAFHRYARHHRGRDLALSFALMALGTLLKVSAGMSLIALLAILFLEILQRRSSVQGRRLFHHPVLACATGLLVLAAVWSWYAYAAWYNQQHGNPFTPNNVWPVWAVDAPRRNAILTSARTLLVPELFCAPVWVVLVGALLAVVGALRRLPGQVAVFLGLLSVGLLAFVLLWFQALDNHDYYFIAPMVVPLALLLAALWWYFQWRPRAARSPWIRGVAVLLLTYSLAYAISGLAMRVHGDSPIGSERFAWLHTAEEIAHWDEDRYWHLRGTLDIEPFSRSLGITREDKVLLAPDATWQTGLYLIGQCGWNDYTVGLADSLRIDHYLRYHGADYLFLLHRDFLDRSYVRYFLSHPLGQHRGIGIYDLRPLR